jgi:membrane-bound metal-dependent hydrolase YbcI (DUF457 family)
MDLIFHLLLPFFLLLLFGIRLKKTEYLILAFFSILPDIDRFILKSRQGFHSIILIVLILLLLFLFLRKYPATRKTTMLLATFGMTSHILFDLGGPVSFLYPLSKNFYTINFHLILTDFIPKLVFFTTKSTAIPQGTGTIISEQGFAVLLFCIILYFLQKKGTKKSHFFE